MSRRFLAIALVVGGSATVASAGLTLSINTLTSDQFSFSISGTFDADVIGDQRNWLAVKPNWSTNFGVNVPWMDDAIGNADIGVMFTVNENSLLFNGAAPNSSSATGINEWGDSFFFDAGFDITAGTTVSGTVTVTRVGTFDDSLLDSDFELLSGFDNTNRDWVRMEAVAPAPGAAALLALGGMLAARRRR